MKKTRLEDNQTGFCVFFVLFCQEKMPFYQHIDEVGNTKDPAPTNNDEYHEHNDMQSVFRSQHNRKSDEKFHNPTDKGD